MTDSAMPPSAAADGGRTEYRRQAWLALSLATLPLTVSFWAVVVAFVAGRDTGGLAGAAGRTTDASSVTVAAAALGVALVAPTLALAASVSGQARPLWAVIAGTVAGFAVAVVVVALLDDVVSALVAGYGLGLAVASRVRPPASHRRRLVGVTVATVVGFILAHTVTALALASGPALAVLAVGLADETA